MLAHREMGGLEAECRGWQKSQSSKGCFTPGWWPPFDCTGWEDGRLGNGRLCGVIGSSGVRREKWEISSIKADWNWPW